ncbi:response regulator [bacterium]|nr:response regulator [bacterium]MBU1651475.1 response regulator [bacterium]MBU1880500.1 response regulator [bacterium]
MSGRQKKILIIDDEPDVVAYLTAFFIDNGFEVVSASNGKEGFHLALSEAPDLITLDITMPEETGIRLLGELKDEAATRQVPVIIITGTPGISNQQIDHAPTAFFEKPIDRQELLEKIRRILVMN